MTYKWTHRFQLKPGRWVFVPSDDGRKTGTRIKRDVAGKWRPPSFYFHLLAGGHLAAVRTHTDSKFFYRSDLDDFFGRVNRSRVTRCLKHWFPYPEAREMASESVVKRPGLDGYVLPYGFVQSAILASVALDQSKLGSLLRSLHRRPDLRVSVYMDDIIVSGDNELALCSVAEQLNVVATAARFPMSAAKQEGPAKNVTAFNIQLAHKTLEITAERLGEFRDAYLSATSDPCKDGIISYVESVNPDQVPNLIA